MNINNSNFINKGNNDNNRDNQNIIKIYQKIK